MKNKSVPFPRFSPSRNRRPYQTRHTYASMMLSAGEHPMWVAKQMGHTDWTMTSRVYGRWMPTNDDDAGGKAVTSFFDASLASEGNKKERIRRD